MGFVITNIKQRLGNLRINLLADPVLFGPLDSQTPSKHAAALPAIPARPNLLAHLPLPIPATH
jgi:hypothetical protein